MREEINNARGKTVPTYFENAKDVVRKYKSQFEAKGVRIFYAKKYLLATKKHKFWFEYVDLDVVENKDYTIRMDCRRLPVSIGCRRYFPVQVSICTCLVVPTHGKLLRKFMFCFSYSPAS